jgi:hypothetical protein
LRKLNIIEHISLDRVIQVSGEDGDFPYSRPRTVEPWDPSSLTQCRPSGVLAVMSTLLVSIHGGPPAI